MVRENGISVFTLQDVDCTLDVNVHQELLCHVLAVRVSPCASLSPRAEQDGEIPQCRMEKHRLLWECAPGIFALVTAGETQRFP